MKEDLRAEFEKVALPYLDRMYQFALHLTRNRDDASDVVQEAYLRAWRFFGSFRTGSNARAWLYRIMHNVFLDQRKKIKRREVAMPEEGGMEDCLLYNNLIREGGWKDPLEMSPARFEYLLGDEVRRAVDQLPDNFKVPLMLCDVDDMAYEEIAKVMGCPVGTVRSRISRARTFIQRELVDYARQHGYLKSRRKK